MVKSLQDHVSDYNASVLMRRANLQSKIDGRPGRESLDAKIDELEIQFNDFLIENRDQEAIAARCEADKLRDIKLRLEEEIESLQPFERSSAEIQADESARRRLIGGARKAWGKWSWADLKPKAMPKGRYTAEAREELREFKKGSPEGARIGPSKPGPKPENTFPGIDGRVFSKKEIRKLERVQRRDFAIRLIESDYPPRIIYAVTGLSKYMQEKMIA